MQKIVYIPVAMISQHPDNPRKELGNLEELAGSIKAKGILQNLTVVPGHWMTREEWTEVSARYKEHPTEEDRQLMNSRWLDTGYTAIIGHRRLAAAKMAGLTEVPCVIADMSQQEQFETMMVENVQRSDLTVYEQAEGFQTMLDMGGTVDQVAQKTGFSETTVRNRVKLLKLDKAKFKKAEQRGATMTDYLKLNEIRDDARRNDVLDAIGTPNFTNKLKNALADEEFEDHFSTELRKLEAADWIRERTDEECGALGNYNYWGGISRYQRLPVERPDDTDVADYVYVVTGPASVNIYRKGPVATKEPTPEETKAQELKKSLDDISRMLKRISETHEEMRNEFVRDFTAVNTYSDEIVTFAARVFLECPGSPSQTKVGEMLVIPVKNASSYNARVDQTAWDRVVTSNPYSTLLCVAVSKLNGAADCYYNSIWDVEIHASVPRHKGNSLMDMFYSGLKSMGYEMSDEEIQMQDGTHPLFAVAKNLVNEYKEGVKNAEV